MPSVTILDIPAATLAALALAAAVRWAFGPPRRPWILAGLVVALAAFAVWRILVAQSGVVTVLDVTAGILCGLLLAAALKAAWRDSPFDRDIEADRFGKRIENTSLVALVFAGGLAALLLVYGFNCLGLVECRPATSLPASGVVVQTLPPGFE